jgi:hypothetical protein
MFDDDEILAVNAAYYAAFKDRDFEAMSRLWAEDGVSCIHPGWVILLGRTAVLGSWRDILRNPDQPVVTCRSATVIANDDEGRVLCIELVEDIAFAVTNQFRRREGVWRMVHHQASPINYAPALSEEEPPPGRLH